MTSDAESPHRTSLASSRRLSVALTWLLALACVAFTRFRIHWPAYTSLHQWLADRGIPDGIRNLDSLLIYTITAFLGALIVHRLLAYARVVPDAARGDFATSTSGLHCLRRGRPGWLPICLLALAPMILGGAIIAATSGQVLPSAAEFWPRVYKGVIRAPIMEELFFRGLLVGVIAAVIGWTGWRFWLNAALAAALFASVHVDWTIKSALAGWPNLLVTFAGGIWYAWLLSRWRSLWVPMLLHAGMNLGWLLAGSAGGAGGGGLIENLLRAATITIATWMTVRRTRQM